MATYIGSMYEDALKAADYVVQNDAKETQRINIVRHTIEGINGTSEKDQLHSTIR